MDKKTIILIIMIFILLVAGMFGYAYLKRLELKNEDKITSSSNITQIAIRLQNQ